MPAVSEKQRRFFGAVMAAKKGKKGVGSKAREAAKGMSKGQIKDFLKKKGEFSPAYLQGFLAKCAEAGVDPEALVKAAQLPIWPAWGGGSAVSNQGVGLEAGWAHLLGLLPYPYIGLRVGGKGGGLSVGGPVPYLGYDTGRPAGYSPRKLRSVWKLVYDALTKKKQNDPNR